MMTWGDVFQVLNDIDKLAVAIVSIREDQI